MNVVPSNIRVCREPLEIRVCSICDTPAGVVGIDNTSNLPVCAQCLPSLVMADVWLGRIGPKIGISHPAP